MPDGSTPRTDIALALFLITVSAVVLFETRDIPPGTFEPLGSAPVPQATAGLIILCSLIVMARAVLSVFRRTADGPADDEDLRPGDALAILLLTVVYVLALQFRVLDFAPTTVVFLFVAIGFLVRFRRRLLPWVFGVAVVMGYGCQYVFTRVFVVDLPGL